MTELATRNDLDVLGREMHGEIETLRREIQRDFDNLSLRLTVRMGVMLAAGLSLLGIVLKH